MKAVSVKSISFVFFSRARLLGLLGGFLLGIADAAPIRAAPVAEPASDRLSPPAEPAEPYTGEPGGVPDAERQIARKKGDFDSKRRWSLPQLVDEALRRNPATKQAWYQARASAMATKVAESAYYPTVTVTAELEPQDADYPAFTGSASEIEQLQFTPGLQIQYLLLDFGSRDATVEAARFGQLAQNQALNVTLQNVVLNVMTNYYGVDAARVNLVNQRTALAYAEKSLQSVEISQRSGLATSTDLAQARQSVAQNQFNVVSAEGQVEQAKAQLAASLGLPADTPVDVAPPAGPMPAGLLSQRVDKLIDLALRRRPDLAQQYAAWQQAQAQAKAADAAIWPTITAGFDVQRTYYDARFSSGGDTTKNSGSFDEITANLTFSFDVFDGGNKLFTARQARELAAAARQSLANTELAAIADVVVHFVAFKSAAKQVTAGEALVASSRLAFESAEISFRNGLSTVVQLLEAQSQLASAESTLATARQDLYTASAELAYATGVLLGSGGATGRSWEAEVGR